MAPQTKPPFAYYGGKTTLAPKIAELLPPHKHYVEPFAGSLAVLLAKTPSKMETVNDLDSDLVNFWRVLRDRPEELEHATRLTPHSREEYMNARTIAGDDLERARRVFTILTQGRSHSMATTGWVVSYTTSKRMPAQIGKQIERFSACADRIANVSLENRDALEMIWAYGQTPTVCIYADPPYLGSTRKKNYRHEMAENELHDKLADALNNCKATVVLSGYASPLYEELFDGWHRTELKAPTSISGRTKENEILWSNTPLETRAALDLGKATQ